MAAEKWSQQSLITSVDAADQFLVIQNSTGQNKRITAANLGVSSIGVTQYSIVALASSVTCTNSTTLIPVTGLTATLLSGKTYHFKGGIFASTDATGGINFKIYNPGALTFTSYFQMSFFIATGSTGNNFPVVTQGSDITTEFAHAQSAVTKMYISFEGTTKPSADGTLVPYFAQSSASGSTVIQGGSFLNFTRIL